MTARAVAEAEVKEPHCILLATYLNDSAALEALIRWRAGWKVGAALEIEGRAVLEEDQEVELHDVAMYAIQGRLPGPFSAEEAGRAYRAYVAARPLPEEERLGLSTVVLARVEGAGRDRPASAEAELLLGALADRNRLNVVGGTLVPGVELWAIHDDSDHLVLFCDDDDRAEVDAGQLLYVNLRVMETAFHKILHQARQARREGVNVATLRKNLARELALLTGNLERLDADETPEVLREAERQGGRTLRAECRLIEAVGNLRSMETSIEANRSNLLAYRATLGDGAGRSALDARLLRTGQELDQIRADVGYCRPLLETTRATSQSHQTRLMTVLSLNEIRENRLREADASRREGFTKTLTLLGLGIGLMQIATAILPILQPRPDDWLITPLWTGFVILLIVSSGLFATAFWSRSPGSKPAKATRP